MAWIVRDGDERLYIYALEPMRRDDEWVPQCGAFGLECDMIELPSNADEKLIGRHIDWESKPVEI